MNNYCASCGKNLEGLGYKCRYCGEYFCIKHQLPENHACQGLEEWKKGKLKKFKKEIKVPEKITLKIDQEKRWLEFLVLIIGVIVLILILRVLV